MAWPKGKPRPQLKPAATKNSMTALLDEAQRLHAEQAEGIVTTADLQPQPEVATGSPEPQPVAETAPPVEPRATTPEPTPTGPVWKRKASKAVKTTVVPCIVIDRFNHWHTGAKVDLHGDDTTPFTWGYYGKQFPVLVEQPDGMLKPWIFQDAVGESSNRLYKGAAPDGFRNTFKHQGGLLQKIQVGLMVFLVLGLFGIMFVLINN